ncbi:MAG: hypothetical protein U0Q16_28445 [Bryobacteraceae bacterium]
MLARSASAGLESRSRWGLRSFRAPIRECGSVAMSQPPGSLLGVGGVRFDDWSLAHPEF